MYDQLFVFSVLMFSAFAVPIIARRTKIPAIVFYILFGVILERFVFKSVTVRDWFHIFSEIGKLYLMFIAGVEMDIFHFKKNVSKSVIFGALSFAVPLALGTVVIINVFGYNTVAALLIAALFASHTLLSLTMINKFGIENSEPVSVVVGATIVSDVAVLGLLAAIADFARGMNISPVYWAGLFGSWALFISAILFFIPKIMRRLLKAFPEDGYAQFLFIFATACLLSWTAHFLRLESLIGAFFCGLALSRLIPKRSALMAKINFVGYTFFIPFFFISAGMLLNPKSLAGFGSALVWGVILTTLAIVAKTAAVFVFGKIFKYSIDATLMMSGMTFQQAATTIVCAAIGLELGVINETMFNAAMILILFTCSVGEVISVHFAGKYAGKLSIKSSGAISESKTLVFVPNVGVCRNLLDFACLFRRHAKKYMISPLALTEDNQESIADAETILGVCMNYASDLGDVYQPEMRIANNAADGILRAAAETRAGMVVCPLEKHYPTLIDECPPRLVFAKIVQSIPITKRIVTVFMPTSEDRSDLTLFISETIHLSIEAGAKITFCLTVSQNKKIGSKLNTFLNIVEYEIILKEHWNAIKRDLPNMIRDNDAIIVSMGTRQKLFRLPSADKYPFHLANRFENNSIIAAYPPLSLVVSNDDENSSLSDAHTQSASSKDLYPKLEAVDTQSRNFKDITAYIGQKIDATHEELYNILLSSLELYPVELTPGAVLVHAHTESISNPRIFIWYQTANAEILPSKISPKALIIVLNPLHGDPQIHLKTLSKIAGLFMKPGIEKIVDESKNCSELIEKLTA